MDDYSHSYAMFYENGHGWPSSRSWIKPKTVQAVMPTEPWGNNIVGIYTQAIMTGSQLTFIFFRGVETTNQMTTYLLKWTNSPQVLVLRRRCDSCEMFWGKWDHRQRALQMLLALHISGGWGLRNDGCMHIPPKMGELAGATDWVSQAHLLLLAFYFVGLYFHRLGKLWLDGWLFPIYLGAHDLLNGFIMFNQYTLFMAKPIVPYFHIKPPQ